MQLKKILLLIGTFSVLTTPVLADEASLQRQIDNQQRTIITQQSQITQLQRDIATLRGEVEQVRYLLTRQNAQPVYGYAPAPSVTQAAPPAAYATPQPTAPVNNQVPAPVQANPNSNVVNIPVGVDNGQSYGKPPSSQGPVTPMGNDNLQYNNANYTPPAPTATNQAPGPILEPVSDAARSEYNAAYAKIQSNDLKGAQAAFQAYVEKYPNNTLTPNAWYWLGQVQYSQAIYDQARLSFLNVARYTDSQKRPDALYKLGMVSKFLGDKDKANRYFQLVIQSYPNNMAASLANKELQRLSNHRQNTPTSISGGMNANIH